MNEYIEFFATLLLVGAITFAATITVAIGICIYNWSDDNVIHHEDFY